MTEKQFQEKALAVIKANPGLNRMQWFNACCTTDEHRNTLWHTFKFHVALVLILGGHVKAEGDKFFHILHKQTPLAQDIK